MNLLNYTFPYVIDLSSLSQHLKYDMYFTNHG